MTNPFFKNYGPFDILDIIQFLKINHDDIKIQLKKILLFFIQKNTERLLIKQKHLIVLPSIV